MLLFFVCDDVKVSVEMFWVLLVVVNVVINFLDNWYCWLVFFLEVVVFLVICEFDKVFEGIVVKNLLDNW